MADLEKVIKAAENYEPYARVFSNLTVTGELFINMLTLLKEQEPIQMKISEDYGLIKFGECPKCKSFINNRYFPKSCGCGQAVKWE